MSVGTATSSNLKKTTELVVVAERHTLLLEIRRHELGVPFLLLKRRLEHSCRNPVERRGSLGVSDTTRAAP